MNPDDQSQPGIVQPPPAWYVEANGGSTSLPPIKPSHHKQFFILAWVLAAIMVIVGGVLLFFHLTTISCLTAADYQTIVGQPSKDALSPTDDFYTGSVSFKEKSSEYNSNDELKIVHSVGQFQSSHPRVSLKVTLTAAYTPTEGRDLATRRLAALRDSFIKAGINKDSIALSEPVAYTPESDLTVTSTPLQYSITSASECK